MIEKVDFDFCHVKPTGMLRGVNELDLLQQPGTFFNWKSLIERLDEMGIQIIKNHHDLFDFPGKRPATSIFGMRTKALIFAQAEVYAVG